MLVGTQDLEESTGDAPRIVLITAPDSTSAEMLARALVGRRLAACANLIGSVKSIYRWQGAVEEASEVLLVLKTVQGRVAELESALASLHPYQVPECVVLAPCAVAAPYLAWLRGESTPDSA